MSLEVGKVWVNRKTGRRVIIRSLSSPYMLPRRAEIEAQGATGGRRSWWLLVKSLRAGYQPEFD